MNTPIVEQATMADVIDAEPRAAQPLVAEPVPAAPRATTANAIAVTTPGDLLRLAAQNGADIGMLERLLDLQQRFEQREAEKAMVKAMAAFKREPIEIYKRKQVGYTTREGDFVGYKHAQLSDVTDAIAPAMARHGLSFRWDVQQSGPQITVDCVVTHELGHSLKVTMNGTPDTSGKKNAIQQVASTVTYLQRYTLLAVTGMSTKDEDDDGQGGAASSSDTPRDDGTSNAQQTRSAPAKAATTQRNADPLPILSDDKFEAQKGDWKTSVKTGRKTAAAMVRFLETKNSLTDAQKTEIQSWDKQGAQ